MQTDKIKEAINRLKERTNNRKFYTEVEMHDFTSEEGFTDFLMKEVFRNTNNIDRLENVDEFMEILERNETPASLIPVSYTLAGYNYDSVIIKNENIWLDAELKNRVIDYFNTNEVDSFRYNSFTIDSVCFELSEENLLMIKDAGCSAYDSLREKYDHIMDNSMNLANFSICMPILSYDSDEFVRFGLDLFKILATIVTRNENYTDYLRINKFDMNKLNQFDKAFAEYEKRENTLYIQDSDSRVKNSFNDGLDSRLSAYSIVPTLKMIYTHTKYINGHYIDSNNLYKEMYHILTSLLTGVTSVRSDLSNIEYVMEKSFVSGGDPAIFKDLVTVSRSVIRALPLIIDIVDNSNLHVNGVFIDKKIHSENHLDEGIYKKSLARGAYEAEMSNDVSETINHFTITVTTKS